MHHDFVSLLDLRIEGVSELVDACVRVVVIAKGNTNFGDVMGRVVTLEHGKHGVFVLLYRGPKVVDIDFGFNFVRGLEELSLFNGQG